VSRRQLLTLAFVLAGLAAATWAFYRAFESSQDQALPPLRWFALAFMFSVAGLVCAGRSWVELFAGDGDPKLLAGGLYTSQLAKYIPGGGAIQVASQVALSRDKDISLGRATMAYPMAALITVVSGATVASGLSFVDSAIPSALRWLALLGLASPALLHRSLTAWVMDRGRSVIKRIPPSDLIPAQPVIWRAFAWSIPMMLATSVAFAALLHPLDPGVSPAAATIAFAAAWVIGFLVIPVPAGIGIREAVLVLILGSVAPGALVAASLAHRMVSISVEVTLIAFNRAARRLATADVHAPSGDDDGVT
jgi:hypothetical protein